MANLHYCVNKGPEVLVKIRKGRLTGCYNLTKSS